MTQEWPYLARWQRQVQFAGNLTYSSYLLHFPLQLAIAVAVAASGIVPPIASPWFLTAYLGVTLGAAALSYRWFELPAQSWIRLRTVKRNA
jgi:peptidoglycan/LPS O-acetylase OafA/YrhL